MTRVGRYALRVGIAALVALGTDQLLDRLVLGDALFLGRPVAPFDPPLFSPSQREALVRIEDQLHQGEASGKFDAQLGWCNHPDSGFGDFRYDWAGARIGAVPLAREKAPGIRRVVAVGCSMTHGEEVGPEETWCSRVDALLDELEVANLGVAAYGIDQALLRLRRDGWPLAPDEVWLGVLPRAALRVTTLFRPLLDHWSLDVAFKPRLQLDPRGELVLVPNPAREFADIPRLLHDQAALLEAFGGKDPWIQRAPLAYAPRGSSWTHGFFVSRLLLTAWESRARDLAPCFDEDADSGRLFTAIVRTLAREVEAHGAVFRLLILPGKDDLLSRRDEGRGYWEAWAERRRADRIRVLDFTEALLGSGLPLDPLFAAHGHYTREASQVIAATLATELRR